MASDSRSKSQGLSVTTLVVSSLAALLAAIIVSLFWERGTLIATAITPVIVALVGEGLARPADRLEEAATSVVGKPTLDGMRHTDSGTAPAGEPSEAQTRVTKPDREERKPSDRAHLHRRIAIGLVTGLLAFGIAAVVLTGTELATGGSLGTDGRTTLFGKSKKSSSKDNGDSQREQTPGSTDQDSGTGQPGGAGEDPSTTPRGEQPGEAPPEEAPPEEAPPEQPGQETPGETGETPAPSGSETTP